MMDDERWCRTGYAVTGVSGDATVFSYHQDAGLAYNVMPFGVAGADKNVRMGRNSRVLGWRLPRSRQRIGRGGLALLQ